MNILILTTNGKGLSTKYLKEACENRGHIPIIYSPSDLYINCSNVKGHDKLYVKEQRIYKKNIDAIIPRTGGGGEYAATIVRHLHKNMNIFSTVSAKGILSASDKMLGTQLLSKANITVPRTTFLQQPDKSDFDYLVNTVNGLPTVCKLQRGSQGQGVFILETKLAGSTTLSSFAALKTNLILQEFIETSKADEQKSDIRAFVVGGKVVASMKRLSIKGGFRSNYSISKEAVTIELTPEEKDIAIRSAKALSLGVAGVDIMRDSKNNKSYVIEVNSNPSLVGITKITGVDVADKIIQYIEDMTDTKYSIETLLKDEEPPDAYYNVMQYLLDGEIDYHADSITIGFDKIVEISKMIKVFEDLLIEYNQENNTDIDLEEYVRQNKTKFIDKKRYKRKYMYMTSFNK